MIGGGEIYAQALPLADVIEFTRVDHIFPEADVFFPKFNTEEWELVSSEPFEKTKDTLIILLLKILEEVRGKR